MFGCLTLSAVDEAMTEMFWGCYVCEIKSDCLKVFIECWKKTEEFVVFILPGATTFTLVKCFFFNFFLCKLFLTCMLRWSLTIFLGSVVHYSSCSLKTPLPPFYVCDFLLYPLWYVLFLCSCCLYLKTIAMTSTIPILSYLPQFLTSTITTSHIF